MTDDLWCNYSDLPNVLAYEKTNDTWLVDKLEQHPEHADRNTITPVENKEEIIKKLKKCQKDLNNLNKD